MWSTFYWGYIKPSKKSNDELITLTMLPSYGSPRCKLDAREDCQISRRYCVTFVDSYKVHDMISIARKKTTYKQPTMGAPKIAWTYRGICRKYHEVMEKKKIKMYVMHSGLYISNLFIEGKVYLIKRADKIKIKWDLMVLWISVSPLNVIHTEEITNRICFPGSLHGSSMHF